MKQLIVWSALFVFVVAIGIDSAKLKRMFAGPQKYGKASYAMTSTPSKPRA